MTNQQLRDEAMTSSWRVMKTTANAMSWIWFLLSQHPGRSEIARGIKDGAGWSYTNCCRPTSVRYRGSCAESMRLYPPVWGMSRVALRDCVMGVLRESWYNCVPEPVGEPQRPRFFDQPSFHPERWADNLIKRLPTLPTFPLVVVNEYALARPAMMEAIL